MKRRFTVYSLPAGRQGSQFTARETQGSSLNSERGFTIIELLIAVFISILAISFVYTSFVIQQRSFVVQDQVSETQMSSKIAFNMVVDDARNSGFGYPVFETPTINGFTGSIIPVEGGDEGGYDSLTFIAGKRQVATLAAPAVIGLNTITISYTDGSVGLNLDDKSFISIDGIGHAKINNCDENEGRCQDTTPLLLDRAINRPYPAGRPVYLIEDITALMRRQRGADAITCTGGNEVDTVVDHIDDLQFAYAIDADSDGQIDDQNGNNRLDPGDYLSPNDLAFQPGSRIMAVRVNILARTRHENQNIEPATKPYFTSGIVLENNTTADTDRLIRKLWSMETALRNPR
jgi:type II secretory pathway pseudopilin PulG